MTKNERELLMIIREHNDPEKALVIAVQVITSFLKQLESSEEPSAAYPPVSAETTL